MDEEASPPITAESLRARPEWLDRYPGSSIVWEEVAEEGVGIGFDGLDPSAMTRAYFRTTAVWADVLVWYRRRFAELGWQEHPVKPDDSWWEWTSVGHPFERLLVMDRGRHPQAGTVVGEWTVPAEIGGRTMFEVMFLAQAAAQPRTRGRA
jgi:hypothetical protein